MGVPSLRKRRTDLPGACGSQGKDARCAAGSSLACPKRSLLCLRNLHTRERLIEHLHKGSPVCLLNTLLFHPRLDGDTIAAADADQRARGKKARSRGENPAYAQQIVRQGFGPLQSLLIPIGHSRESRFFLFQEALKDPSMTIIADFAAIRSALTSGSRSDIIDEIPLVLLPRLAVGQ